MTKKTSASTSQVHKCYEHFLNSYKTFIAIIFCLHIIDSGKIRSMDGV